MSNLYGAARQWASFIPIFPCTPNAKTPATPNGFKDATRDLDTIGRWWSDTPYNIAASPDDAGYYVLDIDGEEGEASLMAITQGRPFRALFQVRTPRGGRHIWCPGKRPSSQSKIGPKIDVRGMGGYVLLPPSIVNGKEYAFLTT